MYAIIETGGKQYRVSPGDVLFLDRLEGAVGSTVKIEKVLLVSRDQNGDVTVGAPYVDKATLEGEIVEHFRGDKLLTVKYRRRKGYRRTIGHRQELTKLLVTKLFDGKDSASFDASKRVEILAKANIATSTKKAEATEKKSVAAKPAKKAPAKASTTKSTATAAKAPAKKAAAKKVKE